MASCARWSELPMDTLCSIQESLPLVEYIRFGAVCRSWRAAAKLQLHPPAPEPPWLMLPNLRDPDRRTVNFMSVSGTTYTFRVPVDDFHERVFLGSSNGWLVTVNRSAELHLLNPLTGAQFQLPPLSTFPNVRLLFCEGSRKFQGIREGFYGDRRHSFEALGSFFRRAIVVPHADGCTVAIIAGAGFRLVAVAFAHVNDEQWTMLRTPRRFCDDIIYHDGLLHGIDAREIITWDLANPNVATSKFYDWPLRRGRWKSRTERQAYLVVESAGGDLLQALELRERGSPPRSTFRIFRLDRGREAWEEVTTLSARSLFLGRNAANFLSSSVFPELSANSIYLTEGSQAWVARPGDLSRRLLASYTSSQAQPTLQPLLWFTPS